MQKCLLLIVAAAVSTSCSSPGPAPAAAAKAPLHDNLGSHHTAITAATPEVQRYFNQGMTLSYAFNHAEAIRAFKQAAALDPRCAMCFWGVAYALGPNINAPITEDAAREAFAAIGQARAQAAHVTDRERAYIEALARRYAADPKAERPPLDRAYADAMRAMVKQFPDDPDAATLFAQSLMDTAPWNYWTLDGQPREFTNEVLAALEGVLAKHPDHPGAIHLYIHAVEASPDPGRATRYADRLAALVPGAGHLVHMPSHIYLRTGRLNEASAANENAIKVDATYVAGNPVAGNMTYTAGYVPHNFHFLVASASLEGRSADALKAANEVKRQVHADMFRDPAMGGMMQHMYLTPLFANVRFARWADVLAEPAPPQDLPYMQGAWQTARGLAHMAEGRLADAKAAHAAVVKARADESLKTLYVSGVNVGAAVLAVADDMLAGYIAAAEKRTAEAVRHLAAAVAAEDALTYMEPPDFPIPARQLQGAALLMLGRNADAERAFRQDLVKFPENGWSLSGLRASFSRQGKNAEAAALDGKLQAAWRHADVKVEAAQVVQATR